MRHRVKINLLGKKAPHRRAMLRGLANDLIRYGALETTVAKSKVLRMFIEPLITKAKEDSTHNRRVVFAALQKKQSVSKLFAELGPRFKDRPGGYTRIHKLYERRGDGALIARISLLEN